MMTNEHGRPRSMVKGVVITTTNGNSIHFDVYGALDLGDGAQLIIHVIEANLHGIVVKDEQGALVFADLMDVVPEDVKFVDDVLRHSKATIAKGDIGLLMLKDIDPWAFKVEDVEVR